MEFYQKKINTVLSDLKTDLQKGLNTNEVNERLKKYGLNKIIELKQVAVIKIFIKQFFNPLISILLIAVILSLLIGEIKDAIVITAAVIINTTVGFMQEWKAEKTLQSLKQYEVLYCTVIRKNIKTKIESKYLVPGDIILLSAGQKVPADIRLTHITNLKIDESLLTGESNPIKKTINVINKDVTIGNRKNIAFSGSNILSGKAIGIVFATGANTQFGKIANLVYTTKKVPTPLQNQIKKFSWLLGIIFLTITFFIFILGLIKKIPIYQIAITSIALGVAAIPEGLLIAVTIILAIGMQKMSKRNALVRNLAAAETLGSVSVICTDKTGTLTEGRMKVTRIITKNSNLYLNNNVNTNKKLLEKSDIKNIIYASILNNDAQLEKDKIKTIGHPTEIALLKLANDLKINIGKIKTKYKRINEIPFSSNLKYMATLHKFNDHQKLIVKGAPEKIFKICKINNIKKYENILEKMSNKGLRILAFAEKQNHELNIKENLEHLNFIGLLGIEDPLRPHAKKTINELTKAGIRVVLVTGDHKNTAKNIALNAGIKVQNKTIVGSELDKMSDEELKNKIEQTNIFARVDPKHKIRIVNAWKAKGKSVAMTGDGVNDAPALKAADIGVALGSGSDVTHEISDIVLLDNDLSSIEEAVKEGRTIFNNIRKIIVYLMSDSFSEIILIGGSLLLNLPLPILATQIFGINLITDGFPYLALTVEPPEKNIMLKKPRKKNEPIINKQMKFLIFTIGLITDVCLLLFYSFLLKLKFELSHIRTIIFTALAIDSLFYIFSIRNMHVNIFKTNPLKNKWLIPAVILGFITQLMVIYIPSLQKIFYTIPLNIQEWGIIILLSLIKVIGIELTKSLFKIKKNKK